MHHCCPQCHPICAEPGANLVFSKNKLHLVGHLNSPETVQTNIGTDTWQNKTWEPSQLTRLSYKPSRRAAADIPRLFDCFHVDEEEISLTSPLTSYSMGDGWNRFGANQFIEKNSLFFADDAVTDEFLDDIQGLAPIDTPTISTEATPPAVKADYAERIPTQIKTEQTTAIPRSGNQGCPLAVKNIPSPTNRSAVTEQTGCRSKASPASTSFVSRKHQQHNRWTEREEVFLCGIVIDVYYRRHSLKPGVHERIHAQEQGCESSNLVWQEIQRQYELSADRYRILTGQRTPMRTAKALQKHWKEGGRKEKESCKNCLIPLTKARERRFEREFNQDFILTCDENTFQSLAARRNQASSADSSKTVKQAVTSTNKLFRVLKRSRSADDTCYIATNSEPGMARTGARSNLGIRETDNLSL